MTPSWLERETALIGEDAVERLMKSSALVCGVGGVGGHTLEALARAGVGRICIVDDDVVSESNINRQIIALRSNIGIPKVEAAAERVRAINPECALEAKQIFITPENARELVEELHPDIICDCIDNVSAKIALAEAAKDCGIPMIMCMGTGNKLDPSRFRITDISKTQVCPLARVMRHELSVRGIRGVKALWSDEAPVRTGMRTPASISFVPAAAGLMIAGEAVRMLMTAADGCKNE